MQVIQFIVLVLVLSIHFHGHGTCQATKIPTTQSIADQTTTTTQSTTAAAQQKEFPLERATRISSDQRNKGKRYNNNHIIIVAVYVQDSKDANDGILI